MHSVSYYTNYCKRTANELEANYVTQDYHRLGSFLQEVCVNFTLMRVNYP